MWPFNRTVKFTEMPFRTDMHSHILPGVDDGFKTLENSVAALQQLREIGLEHTILTPHIYPDIYPANEPGFIRNRLEEVKDAFSVTGVEFRVAGEHMVYNGFEGLFEKKDPQTLTLSQDAILIEMSYAFESRTIKDSIFELNVAGYAPVLAHPERYTFYSHHHTQLKAIIEMDCRLQLNILSLGGFYGNTAKEKAESMLEQGMYTFLGTDLHSLPQIEQLRQLRIQRKHVAAIEKLLQNNDELWKE